MDMAGFKKEAGINSGKAVWDMLKSDCKNF